MLHFCWAMHVDASIGHVSRVVSPGVTLARTLPGKMQSPLVIRIDVTTNLIRRSAQYRTLVTIKF